MPTKLYLDTARMGLMSPTAQQAHRDYVAFAGSEGCSSDFDNFLRHGSDANEPEIHSRYPGLSHWHGIAELKRSLQTISRSPPDLRLLLANRSSQLMRLAARLLFRRCSNVLFSDLAWPCYVRILEAERKRTARRVTLAVLRSAILADKACEDELVASIVSEYRRNNCDGLFLTAVNHQGIRLPVLRIIQTITSIRPLCFVVIDGAQDFCHAPSRLDTQYCDFYMAGCHKWLQAYHPMGLGFYVRRRSQSFIETILAEMTTEGSLDDPLLRFSDDLERGTTDAFDETVSLASLFSCRGAVVDAIVRTPASQVFATRLANVETVAEASKNTGWQPLFLHPSLRSGIVLLQAQSSQTRSASPDAIRAAFQHRGIALTAYHDGVIRLSIPHTPWKPYQTDLLRSALRHCA